MTRKCGEIVERHLLDPYNKKKELTNAERLYPNLLRFACLPKQAKFSVLGWKDDKSGNVVEVIQTLSYGVCPQCGESTNKTHHYKIRSIDDIPIQGKGLQFKFNQRRFKCASCGKVFTERFESTRSRSHRTICYEQYLYERGKNRALKDILVRTA